MEKEKLEQRIQAAQVKETKILKRIDRWEAKKNEDEFIKDRASMWSQDPKSIKTREDLVNARYNYFKPIYANAERSESERYYDKALEEYLRNCENEIKWAKNDLEEIKILINKYLNLIDLSDEKASKPVIQIFKDFFDKWKEKIVEQIEPMREEYYKLSRRSAELWNNKRSLIGTEFATEEMWRQERKDIDQREKELRSNSWLNTRLSKSKEEFNKFIDKYMEDRYYELVDKVTKFTGSITDVSTLYVGKDGTLNGIIKGDEGVAKIETIIAGGYNQNIIVNSKHGQCIHYRVIVKPLKS